MPRRWTMFAAQLPGTACISCLEKEALTLGKPGKVLGGTRDLVVCGQMQPRLLYDFVQATAPSRTIAQTLS